MPHEKSEAAEIKFDLWDVEINRYLGQFKDEADALALVRTLVSHYGPAHADDVELGGITAEGEIIPSLSGAALLSRAERVLAQPQRARQKAAAS